MLQDIESVLLSAEEINGITDSLAEQISKDYKDKPLVLVCILKGSLMFCSELMKKINIPLRVEFMKASSYGADTVSSGRLDIHLDLKCNIQNMDILIIEDIVDSGRTLSFLTKTLSERGAASVRTCTLLDKPSRRALSFSPDYCGKAIPDKFVVGFGLDYNEKYRNLPFVGVLKPTVYGGN